MGRPPPISIRLRHREVTDRAREILRRLDDEFRLQRRVKFFALKAHLMVGMMKNAAEPRLKLLASSDCERWQAEIKVVETILLKIGQRGVL